MEFISAKDLPATEAEEVDVLCVEGGELKRKAGASLGGDAKYDAVIHTTDFLTIDAYTLVSGTYEAVRAKMLADEVPKIKAIWTNTDSNGAVWHNSLCVITVQACEADDEWLWILLNNGNENFWIALLSDNTIVTD